MAASGPFTNKDIMEIVKIQYFDAEHNVALKRLLEPGNANISLQRWIRYVLCRLDTVRYEQLLELNPDEKTLLEKYQFVFSKVDRISHAPQNDVNINDPFFNLVWNVVFHKWGKCSELPLRDVHDKEGSYFRAYFLAMTSFDIILYRALMEVAPKEITKKFLEDIQDEPYPALFKKETDKENEMNRLDLEWWLGAYLASEGDERYLNETLLKKIDWMFFGNVSACYQGDFLHASESALLYLMEHWLLYASHKVIDFLNNPIIFEEINFSQNFEGSKINLLGCVLEIALERVEIREKFWDAFGKLSEKTKKDLLGNDWTGPSGESNTVLIKRMPPPSPLLLPGSPKPILHLANSMREMSISAPLETSFSEPNSSYFLKNSI